jgi:hypothetical protein
MSIITSVLGFLGTGVSSFFGFKGKQQETVNGALNVLKDVNATENAVAAAKAVIIGNEAKSDYWLAGVWRPLLMVTFASLIVARFFGYAPPNMTEAELMRMWDLLELGIGGYIGGRTLEKIVGSVNVAGILNKMFKL